MPQYIYINGYPGVGKLTVAKELQRLLPESKVYDNHLLIDPIAAAVERTSPYYNSMRTDLRRYILDMLSTSEATRYISCIFTDSRDTSEVGSMAAEDYRNTATERGVPFIPVILHCDIDENKRRLVNGQLGVGSNTKLTDVDVLLTIRRDEDLYRFGNQRELELDITNITPVEAAQAILGHVQQVAGRHK